MQWYIVEYSTQYQDNLLRGIDNKTVQRQGISSVSNSVKFIYSVKPTKFREISTNYMSYVVPVKNKVKILQNFVAFSEYNDFNRML